MAGAGRWRRVAGATIAVLLGLPAPASAADSSETSLAAGVLSVVVDDLDGDGIREVIALTADDRDPVAVEAWAERDGAWRSLGRLSVPVTGIPGRTRASAHQDGLGLLAVDIAGGQETLLFVGPDAVESVPGAMEVHAVQVTGGRLVLRSVADGLGPVEQVYPVDVDGDGVDEIIAVNALGFEARRVSLSVMRRSGEGWSSDPLSLPGLPDEVYLTGMVADTDGRPGAEVFVQGAPEYATWRVAVDPDGSTHLDKLVIEDDAGPDGPWLPDSLWITGSIGGRAVVAGGGPDWVTVAWPRGSPARIEGRLSAEGGLGQPPFSIGAGEHERVVLVAGSEFGAGSVRVFGPDLESEEATLETDPMAGEFAALLSSGSSPSFDWSQVYPLLGPVPYGLEGGAPALWLPGAVAWVDRAGDLRLERARTLHGVSVIGSAGTDDEWLALVNGWPSIVNVYLRPIGTHAEQRLTVVPRASLIGETSRAADGGIGLERLDGTEIVGEDGIPRVVSGEEGFTVRVSGPPGSIVMLDANGPLQVVRLSDRPRDLTVKPPRGREDRAYQATIIVVSPGGIGRLERMRGLVVRTGPELSATATTVEGELAATVRGTVQQTGGEVLVDGRPVELAEDGSFELRVDAPLWPRAVEVLARDVLGTEARARVDALGLVDYRGWPWAAIVGVLTVGAGLVLFLRIPRGDRSAPATQVDGDGSLEEILGD